MIDGLFKITLDYIGDIEKVRFEANPMRDYEFVDKFNECIRRNDCIKAYFMVYDKCHRGKCFPISLHLINRFYETHYGRNFYNTERLAEYQNVKCIFNSINDIASYIKYNRDGKL